MWLIEDKVRAFIISLSLAESVEWFLVALSSMVLVIQDTLVSLGREPEYGRVRELLLQVLWCPEVIQYISPLAYYTSTVEGMIKNDPRFRILRPFIPTLTGYLSELRERGLASWRSLSLRRGWHGGITTTPEAGEAGTANAPVIVVEKCSEMSVQEPRHTEIEQGETKKRLRLRRGILVILGTAILFLFMVLFM